MQSLNNLLNRKILTISDPKYSKLKFTVLQWNALPRCYSNPTSYPRAQPEHVNFDYRKDMISQEIRSFDADLVCLEEIDTTDIDFFKSLFNTQKYHFLYEKKVYSNDAVVLAVNKKFEVIETERVVHLKSDDPNDFDNQVSLVAVLKYSEKNFNYYAITRKRQAKQLVSVLEKKKAQYEKMLGENKKNLSVIVCGDFNDVPGSSPVEQFTLNKDLLLQSVFDEEKYTVYHYFPFLFGLAIPYKGVVDFIMHSSNLKVSKKLEGPTNEAVGKDGLLSDHYPSDHMSIFCDFYLDQ